MTTPGPWYYKKSINAHDQGLVISEETGANVAVCYNEEDSPLVAAAPELLEALKALFENCEMIHRYWGDSDNSKQADEAIKAARAAIKKAEG